MGKNFQSETIGDRIKKIRKERGLTLRQMETDIGLSNASISRYENGFFDVPPRIQKLICRTYSINPTWLETGEGEMEDRSKKPVDEILNEIRKDLKIPDIVVSMIKAYVKLPDQQKELFSQFIDSLLLEQGGKKRTSHNDETDSEDISRIA